MKKRSKKLLASMVVCGLLAAPIQAIAESVPVGFQKDVLPITIHADGAYVKTDVAPAVKNKRILLPLRAAGEERWHYRNFQIKQHHLLCERSCETLRYCTGNHQ